MNMKKVMGLLLVILSIVLTACGGNEQAHSEDYELEDVEFPLEEDVTLKFMTSSSTLAPEDPNDKLIFQRLEEETGVHVDWLNFTG